MTPPTIRALAGSHPIVSMNQGTFLTYLEPEHRLRYVGPQLPGFQSRYLRVDLPEAVRIVLECLACEQARVRERHVWSVDHMRGVLREEMEELWESIREGTPSAGELLQVASVCYSTLQGEGGDAGLAKLRSVSFDLYAPRPFRSFREMFVSMERELPREGYGEILTSALFSLMWGVGPSLPELLSPAHLFTPRTYRPRQPEPQPHPTPLCTDCGCPLPSPILFECHSCFMTGTFPNLCAGGLGGPPAVEPGDQG